MIYIHNKRDYTGPGEYVGRPSILGNLWRAGNESDRDRVCNLYHRYLKDQIEKGTLVGLEITRLRRVHKDTGELHLICWCSPKRCHAESIKKFIEED